MRFYHTPSIFRYHYNRNAIWSIPVKGKSIYLTFDDGPTPGITSWVLNLLDEYHAKATFFCIGSNVEKNKQLYSEILQREHSVGNHTFDHLHGWKTNTVEYGHDIIEAGEVINSKLFRPPYGKMKRDQKSLVDKLGYKTVLWSVLSYDFDPNLDKELAFRKIKKLTKPGCILVFHDSIKAYDNLKILLPETLEYFSRLGYTFEKIIL
jgi:peptidoglycan-N-acetylglucosamine deacetylase